MEGRVKHHAGLVDYCADRIDESGSEGGQHGRVTQILKRPDNFTPCQRLQLNRIGTEQNQQNSRNTKP